MLSHRCDLGNSGHWSRGDEGEGWGFRETTRVSKSVMTTDDQWSGGTSQVAARLVTTRSTLVTSNNQ